MAKPVKRYRSDGLPLTTVEGYPLQWIRTSVVGQHCNPFAGCWWDVDTPLRFEEIDECLARNAEHLHPPTAWEAVQLVTDQQRLSRRRVHVEKMAWFVRQGFRQPIEVDVGIPHLHCHVEYKVQDGNHRLAAALYRSSRYGEDPLLPLSVAGSVDYAIELGLWEDDELAEASQ